MRTVCTSGIKNSASQTCTQCPPAEQLSPSPLSLFEGNKKCSACTICYLSSYRTYYPNVSYKKLCIMHCACCAVSAVLSSNSVLSCPARSFCLKNPIREQVRRPFDPGLKFLFFARLRGWAAEEKKEDEEEEMGIFLGGVLRMEGVRWLGWARSCCRFFFSLCLCLSGSG